MKWICFALFAGASLAQDITFTNRAATFTNLEGHVYTNVALVKANNYGIIYKGDGMGMVPYTKLSPAFLKSLGIPVERIEKAKALQARQAAVAARQDQISLAADEQARKEGRAEAARWEAGAPARQREAERKAALEQIQTLSAQIAELRQQLRQAQANASDQNQAAPAGTYYYVPNQANRQLEIDNAEDQLRQMKADFKDKFGKL